MCKIGSTFNYKFVEYVVLLHVYSLAFGCTSVSFSSYLSFYSYRMFAGSSVSVNTSWIYAYQFILLKASVMMPTGSRYMFMESMARSLIIRLECLYSL